MSGNRATVVFADDDVNVSTCASELLRPNYDVIGIAVDGKDALRLILQLAPDFVILDISMPQIDGIAVARQLRDAHCNSKIVFLTVIEDEDYVDAVRKIGQGYVVKRRISLDLLAALEAANEGKFFSSMQIK